jgi:hypothetical protein
MKWLDHPGDGPPGAYRPGFFREIAAVVNAVSPSASEKLKAVMARQGPVPVRPRK